MDEQRAGLPALLIIASFSSARAAHCCHCGLLALVIVHLLGLCHVRAVRAVCATAFAFDPDRFQQLVLSDSYVFIGVRTIQSQ